MGYDIARVELLRKDALTATQDYREFGLHFYRSLREKGSSKPYAARVGDALYDAFDNTAPYIKDGELIIGRMAARAFTDSEQEEMNNVQEWYGRIAPPNHGRCSHMDIDYELLLTKGIDGVMADINSKRTKLDLTNPIDLSKDIFYAACVRALEGVIRFAERYALHAESVAATCADSTRKAELLSIAANLRNVPRKPASSFYEAIQSIHFITFCLSAKPFRFSNHIYQLGRLDRLLIGFYERDLAVGRITPDFAQTLIDCVSILMNVRVPSGLAVGFMVGGRGNDGKVVSNAITRMSLESIRHVRMVYPGVGFCWCEDTPDEDLRLACEILGEGHSHPAIFGDDTIAKGLEYYGVPASESHSYIHSSCVEITPAASSNIWVASTYMNLTQKLLDVLAEEHASIDRLIEAFLARVEDGIRADLIEQTALRIDRAKYTLDPLLSCFVNDCIEKGIDIEAGGARYNWIMPSFVGLSNVVDSIAAIEKYVFGTRELDFGTLRAALAANFAGYEYVRAKLNNAPKYGNDNDIVDRYALMITERLNAVARKYANPANRVVPSLFCYTRHDEFGKVTGASPDGRLAGFPLGDGSGPAQGREMEGPTAAVVSSTKWEHMKFIGGIAVNMKFSKKMFDERSIDKLIALVKTYFERGGFELQVNVVDRDTLLAAKENPEAYADLVVRIGGYSDYFVRLTKTMQAEVLARTEF